VPLVRVVEETQGTEGIAGVRLISATGYNHTYPWAEAQKILLATHVGGEVLAPRHGYPLRAVVPDRRGWFWVKWLNRIQILDDPLATVGGVLYAPRQVLRQF
jgi:DMSO/TMAO reductase YedYZ molybdopterin-dependent catalytic subunit